MLPGGAPVTIAGALKHLRQRLAAAGIEEPAAEARAVLVAALACAPADLIRDPDRELRPGEVQRLEAIALRREQREPLTRILGEREFYGRPFRVTPDVLDPRADTETLIEAALAIARSDAFAGRALRILDIGTGSGAILTTLLAELPAATGTALDISEPALSVAAANAHSLGVADRATFLRHDILCGWPSEPAFDLVVSNPPYIESATISGLDPEVQGYDPHISLDGGCDGMTFYRAILNGWAASITKSMKAHALVLELGSGQYEAVRGFAKKALKNNGITSNAISFDCHPDLAGHDRCLSVTVAPFVC